MNQNKQIRPYDPAFSKSVSGGNGQKESIETYLPRLVSLRHRSHYI